MTLETRGMDILYEALRSLDAGFDNLPNFTPESELPEIKAILMEVAEKMRDNFPYPHPLYAGQMIKPPHPVARMAYMLSLWINPNNHALDGGRCSSAMEKEAVAQIARMFGWERHLGHLCGGGTMANLEALWVAGSLGRGKKILASRQAHYTHQRICGVLQVPFESVPCDGRARMDVDALKRLLDRGDVGTVVVTVGSTATGSVDPLVQVLELREHYGFRIHADCAYGGYFILADNLDPHAAAVYAHLAEVDSIAVDPHKHGLQPYGCGCVLFKDPSVGRLYKHDSPYTYFSSSELHLGEISLECSRPGSAAVALWATQRMLPLEPGGKFARDLVRGREAALRLYERLETDPRFVPLFRPELDIVVWVPKAHTARGASALTDDIFRRAASENVHLAKANMPGYLFAKDRWQHMELDRDHVTCLRSCLMKPEHLDWIDRIYEVIERATPAL